MLYESAGGPARLGEARRGSSSSPPATSQHGSSLDGCLPSILSAFCTASPSSLGRSAGPGRAVSGAMARSEYHAYELSGRVAGSGLARRAARRRAAHHPFNSVFCLASLAATASGGRRRPPRFASAATPTTRASARRRVACGGPAWRAARRERGQQAVQRSLTRSERR